MGLVLSVMPGPAFFILIQTSIEKGVKSALSFDLGVLFADLIYITLSFVFFNEIAKLTAGENQTIVKLIGGIIFIGFGIYSLFKSNPRQGIKKNRGMEVKQNQVVGKDYWMLFIKGFVLNLLNPGIIFYWFGLMTLGSDELGANNNYLLMFFLAIILIVFFSVDILKVLGAKRLQPYMTPTLFKALNVFTAIVLLGFGVVLVIRASTGM